MFFQIRKKEIKNMFLCGKHVFPILKGNNSRQQDISVPVYAGKGSECDKNVSRAPFPLSPDRRRLLPPLKWAIRRGGKRRERGSAIGGGGAKRDIFCPHKMEREKDLDEEKFFLLEVPIYPTKISTLLFGKCCSIFRRESRMRHVCIPPSLSPLLPFVIKAPFPPLRPPLPFPLCSGLWSSKSN